eukprot:4036454-Amphidinium_carterae.1
MAKMRVASNQLAGTLPERGMRLPYMEYVHLSANQIEGSLPEAGCIAMSSVSSFLAQNNRLTGPFRPFRSVRTCFMQDNYMDGSLPTVGLRGMSSVFSLDLACNLFSGTLPEVGVHGLWSINMLSIHECRLAGTLPGELFRSTLSGEAVSLFANRLSGTVPGAALQPHVLGLMLRANKFSGALLDAPRSRSTQRTYLIVSDNYFQGALPSEKASPNLRIYMLSKNLFTGSLPGALMDHNLATIAVGGMHLEGTVPLTMSRLRKDYIQIILGHGLAGVLPCVPRGTLKTLSAWGNGLQGHLQLPWGSRSPAWELLL